MIVLADKVAKSFGGRTLYSQATLQMNAGERWALVGPNGSGKTTLLKILMGDEVADEGTVSFARGTTIGYLEQEARLAGHQSALSEVMASATEIQQLGASLTELEAAPAEPVICQWQKIVPALDGLCSITSALPVVDEGDDVASAYAWGDEDDEHEHVDDLEELDEDELAEQEPFLLFE